MVFMIYNLIIRVNQKNANFIKKSLAQKIPGC